MAACREWADERVGGSLPLVTPMSDDDVPPPWSGEAPAVPVVEVGADEQSARDEVGDEVTLVLVPRRGGDEGRGASWGCTGTRWGRGGDEVS